MENLSEVISVKKEPNNLMSSDEQKIATVMQMDIVKEESDYLIHSELYIKAENFIEFPEFESTSYEMNIETDEPEVKINSDNLLDDINEDILDVNNEIQASSSSTPNITNCDCNCIIESLFENGFDERPNNEKEIIINNGRPEAFLSITHSRKHFVRRFRDKIYKDVQWICGCKKLQKLFCWPCILFSKEINVWNKFGFDDLNNLGKARKRHEISKSHIDSWVKLKQFKNQNQIEFHLNSSDSFNIENYNKKVTANRYIISKLIDVICFLSEHELAVKGRSEIAESDNKSNYIELVYLLSTADILLKTHLANSTVFSHLSNSIVNKLIQSITKILMKEIKNEIEKAPFVAVIIDGSSDISQRAQLSTIFRYVGENGNIEERFVGFTDISEDKDALFLYIKNQIEEYQCMNKLVAHTYDGAAILAYQHNGVQKETQELTKHAIFIHYYAHRLNLVLSQTVNCINACKFFFTTLTAFSSFFSNSTKRSQTLNQNIKRRFPSAKAIRWNCNSRIIKKLMDYKQEIKLSLLNMIESPEQWDAETTITARGLRYYLTDLDFQFLLLVFGQIFAQSDILSDTLQNNSYDTAYCMSKVHQFIVFLRKKRCEFKVILDELNASEIEPSKRLRFNNVESKEESYQCLFFKIIDTLIQNTIDRFSNLKSLQFLSLLNTTKFKDYKIQFPEKSFKSLQDLYVEFFDIPKLRGELQYLYSCPEYVGKSLTDIKNILINDNLHQDVLKELFNLISLIFTLPNTSTTSTMKRIHTFVRNTQTNERLSSLAILSVEKELLYTVKETSSNSFYDNVINDFAEKDCEIELIYKT